MDNNFNLQIDGYSYDGRLQNETNSEQTEANSTRYFSSWANNKKRSKQTTDMPAAREVHEQNFLHFPLLKSVSANEQRVHSMQPSDIDKLAAEI
jgi:hypothetical protein